MRKHYLKLFIAAFALVSFSAQAKNDLGGIYLVATDPFFAEIPVCNIDSAITDFQAKISERESSAPNEFIEATDVIFESFVPGEGLITISSSAALPKGASLAISLEAANTSPITHIYSDYSKQAPQSYSCAKLLPTAADTIPVLAKTRKVLPTALNPTPTKATPQFIDVVRGDSWRNLAEMINIAFYDGRFSDEQVMVALRKKIYENNPTSAGFLQNKDFIPLRVPVPSIDEIAAISSFEAISYAQLLDSKPYVNSHDRENLQSSFLLPTAESGVLLYRDDKGNLFRQQMPNQKPQSFTIVKNTKKAKSRTELKTVKKKLGAANKTITSLRSRINLLDKKIIVLNQQAEENIVKITKLQEILQISRADLSKVQAKVDELEATNDELLKRGLFDYIVKEAADAGFFVLFIIVILLATLLYLRSLSNKIIGRLPERIIGSYYNNVSKKKK